MNSEIGGRKIKAMGIGEVAGILRQMKDLEAELGVQRDRAARAEAMAQVRADYDLRCDDCGGAHWLDTVIPSPVWNAICRNGVNDAELLCALCIDKRLKAAGIEGTEAEFYFVGKALVSRLYDEAQP